MKQVCRKFEAAWRNGDRDPIETDSRLGIPRKNLTLAELADFLAYKTVKDQVFFYSCSYLITVCIQLLSTSISDPLYKIFCNFEIATRYDCQNYISLKMSY